MDKLLSRKFWLAAMTYVVFVVFFALGMIPVNWFCLSLLGLSLFYFIANVWQKQIEGLQLSELADLIKSIKEALEVIKALASK